MKNYYIPISTRNFNTLFETESISPKSYYQLRNFGNQPFRDTTIDAMHLQDNLLLYSELPYTSNSDVMYVKVSLELLDINLIATIVEGVWAYPKTIYFSPSYIQILFLTESQQQDTLIFAQNFTTPKLEKYSNCFKVIDTPKFVNYDFPLQNITNAHKEQTIENDYFFNHLKGLSYGFVIGSLSNVKSNTEKELLNVLQAISNSFTTFNSLIVMKENPKESFKPKNPYEKPNKFYQAPPTNTVEKSKTELLNLIKTAENIFYTIFPQELANQRNRETMLKPEIEWFTDLMRTQKAYMFELDSFEEIGRLMLLNPFEKITFLLKEYTILPKYQISFSSEYAERKAENIRTVITDLKRQVEEVFTSQNTSSTPKEFDFAKYWSITPEGTITVHYPHFDLSEQEGKFLEIILTVLFKEDMKRANTSELTNEEKAKIIETVGKQPIIRANEELTQNLRNLYTYFKKFGAFQIENQQSEVLKNFACFLVKSDNLDELIQYLETKQVAQKRIGIALWGLYNGFSSIHEKHLKQVWAKKIDVDTYLNGVYSTLKIKVTERFAAKPTFVQPSNKPTSLPSKSTREKLKESYERVLSKYPQLQLSIKKAFEAIPKYPNDLVLQRRIFIENLSGTKTNRIKSEEKEKIANDLFNIK